MASSRAAAAASIFRPSALLCSMYSSMFQPIRSTSEGWPGRETFRLRRMSFSVAMSLPRASISAMAPSKARAWALIASGSTLPWASMVEPKEAL